MNADYIEKLPKGKHSCKGVGRTHPDPAQSVHKDGIEFPIGKPVDTPQQSSLLYNEYPFNFFFVLHFLSLIFLS